MGIDKTLSDAYPSIIINGRKYHYGKDEVYGEFLVEHASYAKDYWSFNEEVDLRAFLTNLPESADRNLRRRLHPDWLEVTPEQRDAYFEQDKLLFRAWAEEKVRNGMAHSYDMDLEGKNGPHEAQNIPNAPSSEKQATIRELFDTTNRVQFAEYIKNNATSPEVAMNTSDRVRQVYFREAEKTWGEFREQCEFYEPAEILETLEAFKAREQQLGDAKTLMDRLQEGGLFVRDDLNPHEAAFRHEGFDSQVSEKEQTSTVRPLTQQLIDCCQLDVWPGNAAVIDFGLDSSSHLGALQFAIREELVTPQELDAAMGKGEKLTEIARRGDNPYRDVMFKTSWDEIGIEPESGGGGSESAPAAHSSLHAELQADYHAARVRDYGAADAATYGQRVKEGTAMPISSGPPHPWPSEIAHENKRPPAGQQQGKSNEKTQGRDDDHSM
jgi:hypothetical protein